MTVDGFKKHPVFVGYTALDSYTHVYDLMCWFTVAQLQTFPLSERILLSVMFHFDISHTFNLLTV